MDAGFSILVSRILYPIFLSIDINYSLFTFIKLGAIRAFRPWEKQHFYQIMYHN